MLRNDIKPYRTYKSTTAWSYKVLTVIEDRVSYEVLSGPCMGLRGETDVDDFRSRVVGLV